MSGEEQIIHDKAVKFAKEKKWIIAAELTNTEVFLPDPIPVSVFMAGSPGAGKTEASERLIERLSNGSRHILRIDSDELRVRLPGYNGKNSHLFQGATSIIADKVHDIALENKQSFVFDGTLTNLARARENIERSLGRSRFAQIIYVYQDPKQAWEFVKKREIKDGRNVPPDAFIRQYFQARENVNILKREFGNKLQVDLIVKNIDGTDFLYRENIDVIDNHIPERYNNDDLEKIIR